MKPTLTRRQLAVAGLGTLGFGALGGGFGRWAKAAASPEYGLADDPSHRLVVIFLDGGWTSNLSVDPVYGPRLATGNFEPIYNTHDVKAPSGKAQLMTGIGFQDAFPAFSAVPTAFVNGMFVEIAAHDAAAAFMLTGKQLIGRVMTEPSLPARLATTRGGLASHVVLGDSIPLGATIETAPPLLSTGESLGDLLSEPGDEFKSGTREAINDALAATDALFYASLGKKSQTSLDPFRAAQKDLRTVFSTFSGKLKIDDALKARYLAKDDSNMSNFAAAYLALKLGLSSIVTIRFGRFDTHSNETGTQIPAQKQVATALNTFVEDLRNTPDPNDPSRSLMDQTTIMVTSEFTRTPKYNDTAGTDHQSTASAIVMGKGVRDNVVCGRTSDTANAMGWDGTQGVPKNDDTMIDGAALVASFLDAYGQPEMANAVSARRVRGLFT